jgi:hypothetical protein
VASAAVPVGAPLSAPATVVLGPRRPPAGVRAARELFGPGPQVSGVSSFGQATSLVHAGANGIIRQAWQSAVGREATDLEAAYAQAIAWGENRYGRAGQFANFAADGDFNWGSLHARTRPPDCGPGARAGVDVRPVCFLVFPSDVQAATVFVRNLTTRWPVIPAMKGSPEDVARAMRSGPNPPYYEGPAGTEDEKVAAYANLIRSSLRAIASGAPVPEIPSGGGSSGLRWLLALGALGAGTYYLAATPGGASLRKTAVREAKRLLRRF